MIGFGIISQSSSSNAICSSGPKLLTQSTVLCLLPPSPHETEQCCHGPVHHLEQRSIINCIDKPSVGIQMHRYQHYVTFHFPNTITLRCWTEMLITRFSFVIRFAGIITVTIVYLSGFLLHTHHILSLVTSSTRDSTVRPIQVFPVEFWNPCLILCPILVGDGVLKHHTRIVGLK